MMWLSFGDVSFFRCLLLILTTDGFPRFRLTVVRLCRCRALSVCTRSDMPTRRSESRPSWYVVSSQLSTASLWHAVVQIYRPAILMILFRWLHVGNFNHGLPHSTAPSPILVIPSARIGNDKYRFLHQSFSLASVGIVCITILFYIANLDTGVLINHLLPHRRECWGNLINRIIAEAYGVSNFDVFAKINLTCLHFKPFKSWTFYKN